MPPLRPLPSPEVAALRAAAQGIVRQLARQAREQARLIRSGAAGELTEADVERMGKDITDAARTRLDEADPHRQDPSADPRLQTTRREVAQLVASTARQVDAELREAWRTRNEKAPRRGWRR